MRILTLAAVAILTVLAAAQERKKSDIEKLAGQTRVFEAEKGELSRKDEFRTHEKTVYQRERNIGTIQTKGDSATLLVRSGTRTLNGRNRREERRHGMARGDRAWQRWKRSIVFRPTEETIKERPERKKGK